MTWLLSGLIRPPIWVRMKNAAGIRCTWSKRDGQSMLLTGQNVRKALVVSDYTYVMAEGRIALEGPADGVSGREEVQRALLGM
jgi:ABC-type branched-subunit amino acid transport system ATPase component